MSVSMIPGAMQLTVMERLTSSTARALVAPIIPAFFHPTETSVSAFITVSVPSSAFSPSIKICPSKL